MSSQDGKDEKEEAADILAAPAAVPPPISDNKDVGNPAAEVEAADSLLVRSPCFSHIYFTQDAIDHHPLR